MFRMICNLILIQECATIEIVPFLAFTAQIRGRARLAQTDAGIASAAIQVIALLADDTGSSWVAGCTGVSARSTGQSIYRHRIVSKAGSTCRCIQAYFAIRYTGTTSRPIQKILINTSSAGRIGSASCTGQRAGRASTSSQIERILTSHTGNSRIAVRTGQRAGYAAGRAKKIPIRARGAGIPRRKRASNTPSGARLASIRNQVIMRLASSADTRGRAHLTSDWAADTRSTLQQSS